MDKRLVKLVSSSDNTYTYGYIINMRLDGCIMTFGLEVDESYYYVGHTFTLDNIEYTISKYINTVKNICFYEGTSSLIEARKLATNSATLYHYWGEHQYIINNNTIDIIDSTDNYIDAVISPIGVTDIQSVLDKGDTYTNFISLQDAPNDATNAELYNYANTFRRMDSMLQIDTHVYRLNLCDLDKKHTKKIRENLGYNSKYDYIKFWLLATLSVLLSASLMWLSCTK